MNSAITTCLVRLCGAAALLFCSSACAGSALDAAIAAARPRFPNTLATAGAISGAGVDALKRMAAKDPDIKALQIDSSGGELPAALELAELVRSRGWDVIVLNKCLSACAYFVFPAGRHKTVLPHAWVGIHSVARLMKNPDGSPGWFSGAELRVRERALNEPGFWAEVEHIAQFRRSLGVSAALENEFDAYMTRRKRMLGVESVDLYAGAADCPRYKMWALTRQQLEAMGVTGIQSFWYPGTEADRNALTEPHFLPAGSIFFGDVRQLRSYCKGAPLGWMARQWLAHKPAWWS